MFPVLVHGAPTVFDEGHTQGTSVSQLTFSVDSSGSNRLIYAGGGMGGTIRTVTSVTYNGDALAESFYSSCCSDVAVAGYYLVAPDTGTNDVVFTWNGLADYTGAGAIVVNGVDQSDPLDTAATANGISAAPSVNVTSAVGDLVVDIVFAEEHTEVNSDASQTEQWTQRTEAFSSTGMSTEAGAASVTMSWVSGNDDWLIGGDSINPVADPSTKEQEGFAFGDDDGNEASHTLDTQDTNVTEELGVKTLRALINATDDPPTIAYKLKYQKNGAGGYADVPVGSSSTITPTPDGADGTESGNNTATNSWDVSTPDASTGDLLIFGISWDDSTNTTVVTAPAGPNGETLIPINATPEASSGTAVRTQAWYTKATGTWTAGSLTFTPDALEQWTAVVLLVPAGEFDATTPIGATTTEASALGTETDVNSGAFTAGASDGGGRLFAFTAADADPQTVAADWTEIDHQDRGAVSAGLYMRDVAVSNSESISADAVSTIASGAWASVSFIVRGTTETNEIYVSTSANVTAGGENTTARLTAPAGKTTSDFDTGRRWDDENGSDSLDITADDYTEFEWVLTTQSPATTDDYFEFRVYNGDLALDTYTVTPKWTIGSAGGAASRSEELFIMIID